MKMTWEAPRIEVQPFVANEYVAACGDSGKTYLFKCDAGGGQHGDVYQETNGYDGLQWWGDTYMGGYKACGTTHEAESDDEFLNGYLVTGSGRNEKVTPVIIWTDHGTNIHCTTNLDVNTWETAKS